MDHIPEPLRTMFWHEHDANQLMTKIQDRPLLLIGGRGIGKTSILARIAQQLTSKRGDDVCYIAGRDTAEARRLICSTRVPQAVLLIDDLDILLTAALDDRLDDLLQVVSSIWWHLHNQPRDANTRRAAFLATASIEFQSPSAYRLTASMDEHQSRLKWTDSYSQLTESLERYVLNPWSGEWRQRWEDDFACAFSPRLGLHLTGLWQSAILDLTGGHPALFGPAIDRLDKLCASGQPEADIETFERRLVACTPLGIGSDEKDDIYEEIRRYVEDFLSRDAVRRIRSAIRKLKDSPETTESLSFEALTEIARENNPKGARPPKDPNVRRILRDEGLVFQDSNSGNLLIPGSLVRGLILQSVTRSQSVITINAKPDGGDEGELCLQSSSGEEKISLAGAPWRVLHELFRRQGEIVSAADLKDNARLVDDKRAVANAIQRLLAKLRPYNLTDLIVNEYNKGYRLVLPKR